MLPCCRSAFSKNWWAAKRTSLSVVCASCTRVRDPTVGVLADATAQLVRSGRATLGDRRARRPSLRLRLRRGQQGALVQRVGGGERERVGGGRLAAPGA